MDLYLHIIKKRLLKSGKGIDNDYVLTGRKKKLHETFHNRSTTHNSWRTTTNYKKIAGYKNNCGLWMEWNTVVAQGSSHQ